MLTGIPGIHLTMEFCKLCGSRLADQILVRLMILPERNIILVQILNTASLGSVSDHDREQRGNRAKVHAPPMLIVVLAQPALSRQANDKREVRSTNFDVNLLSTTLSECRHQEPKIVLLQRLHQISQNRR